MMNETNETPTASHMAGSDDSQSGMSTSGGSPRDPEQELASLRERIETSAANERMTMEEEMTAERTNAANERHQLATEKGSPYIWDISQPQAGPDPVVQPPDESQL